MNLLGDNRGGDPFIVPRGRTGVERYRLRPDPRPASQERANAQVMARNHPRFQLRDAGGRLLHMSVAPAGELIFCTDPAHAWVGFRSNLVALRARFPQTERLMPVRVLPGTGLDRASLRSL
jgi:hypothetical protein